MLCATAWGACMRLQTFTWHKRMSICMMQAHTLCSRFGPSRTHTESSHTHTSRALTPGRLPVAAHPGHSSSICPCQASPGATVTYISSLDDEVPRLPVPQHAEHVLLLPLALPHQEVPAAAQQLLHLRARDGPVVPGLLAQWLLHLRDEGHRRWQLGEDEVSPAVPRLLQRCRGKGRQDRGAAAVWGAEWGWRAMEAGLQGRRGGAVGAEGLGGSSEQGQSGCRCPGPHREPGTEDARDVVLDGLQRSHPTALLILGQNMLCLPEGHGVELPEPSRPQPCGSGGRGWDSPWRTLTAGPPAGVRREGAPLSPALPACWPAYPAVPAAWPGHRGSPAAAAGPPAAPASCPASAPWGWDVAGSSPAHPAPSPALPPAAPHRSPALSASSSPRSSACSSRSRCSLLLTASLLANSSSSMDVRLQGNGC